MANIKHTHTDGKVCIKCHEFKVWDEFGKQGKKKDGSQKYSPYCKACNAIISKERWHNDNKDAHNAKRAERRRTDEEYLEQTREASRTYYANNKTEYNAKRAERRRVESTDNYMDQ